YLALRPRLWRTQSGHQEIAESCPELQREFPEPPLRGFGVVGKVAAGEEVLRLLRLDPSKGIEEASIRGMLEEPSREMWDHDVVSEALDTAVEIAEREDLEVRGSSDRDSESPEVGVEVNGVLAEVALDPALDRLLCLIGKPRHVEGWFDSEGECVVLELLTQHLVLTRSARTIFVEQLAIQARDAAGVWEFRVTGSIRTAWYEAQRRDPSLTAAPNPSLQWCSQLTVSWKETLA
ncbi:pol, partial [Symbiodinium microadriaticum]